MNKPLGCLSRSGLAAAMLVLVSLAGVGLVWGGLLFSPGALSAQGGGDPLGGVRSHAETGGRCSACHVPFWSNETMSDRCVLCHANVAAQLRDPTSLHGALMRSGEMEFCRDCHPEHRGSNAPLTALDPSTFPHQATGYSLQGHQQTAGGSPFACADCHGEDLTHSDPARCAGCHRDLDAAYMQAHETAFGPDCLACHDGLDSYGASFDHAQTAFPLAGRHAPLVCTDCHGGARTIAELRDAPQDCFTCHGADDAHAGQFGRDCAACHTADDWGQATFDHSQTAFPLSGAHLETACAQCHASGVYQGTPQDCAACHEDPPFHRGLLGSECASCHDAAAWLPARYDRAHTFPINHGEGSPSLCQTCHPDALSAYTCYGCHEHDPAETERKHREEGIADLEDCVSCHPTGQEGEIEEEDD
jgi:hypothetical protein